MAGAVQGTRAHGAWSFFCWESMCPGRTLSPSDPCPRVSWRSDTSSLIPGLSSSTGHCELPEGRVRFKVGFQSLGLYHLRAWAIGTKPGIFQMKKLEVQRRGSDFAKVTLPVGMLNPRCSGSRFWALSTVLWP